MRPSRSFWSWIAPALVFAIVGGGVAVAATHRFYDHGEGSPQAQQFVTKFNTARTNPAPLDAVRVFGHDGAKKSLVLFDTGGNRSDANELSAVQAGALASHFGKVTMAPVSSYKPGQMRNFDAVIYVGFHDKEKLPAAFVDDARAQLRPVLWIGEHADLLAQGPKGQQFVSSTGWDPREMEPLGTTPSQIQYGSTLLEYPQSFYSSSVGTLKAPAKSLAQFVCPTVARCNGSAWAIRAGNIFYVGDDVFAFTTERSRHLVVADMMYDLFGVEVPSTRKASIRLEDIDVNTPTDKLKRVVDMLADRHIPFQMAVIPVRIDKTPDGKTWRGIALNSNPDLISVLKYAVSKGGTLVQHGTTHQWADQDNPYSGESAADYEFIRAVCTSRQESPNLREVCRDESWISIAGPLPVDDVDAHLKRIRAGQEEFRKADLPVPTLFTTPHYVASPRAYMAMTKAGVTRYERTNYYAGMVTGKQSSHLEGATLPAPYAIHDIYGGKVLPETLGNISVTRMNNHPARAADTIIENAKAQCAVRESVAALYFHPFLDPDMLLQAIDGLTMQGFGFVPEAEVSSLYGEKR